MEYKFNTVVIVYDYAYLNGGAANVAINSAIALAEKGICDVIYFTAVGSICDELKNSKVKVKCINQKDINYETNRLKAVCNGIYNKHAEREFNNLLETLDPENTVIHIHGWSKALSVSIVKAASKKRFYSIITSHDYFSICPNGGFFNYRKNCICDKKRMKIDCIFCNCDKRNYFQKLWRCLRQVVQNRYIQNNKKLSYISISDLNKKLIENQVKSSQFYKLNNPVEMDSISELFHEKSKCFLYVGRLSNEKGIGLFCEGIKWIKSKNYEVKGIVVGDGKLKKMYEEKYPYIEFVGWKNKDEVQNYLREARILVFPSVCYEGAPLTIVEAMLLGLPCIVSDCTSATDLVVDEYNGLVFETNNINSLNDKLVKALDDDMIYKFEHNINIKELNHKYSTAYHIDKLCDIYNHVIEKS